MIASEPTLAARIAEETQVGTMKGMIAPMLLLMLSLNPQQTGQSPKEGTSDRSASVRDCRVEYRQAMDLLEQMMARLDVADRSHDVQTIHTAVIDARRLLASVKAKVAACTVDNAATVTVDPVCRDKVDLKTAPTATDQGKQYVFCSEADKANFEKDPKRCISEGAR